MLKFIATIILMSAFAVIIYLVISALPDVEVEPKAKKSIIDKFAQSEIPGKIDAALNRFLAKILRRLKVVVLKADNFINGSLKNLKPSERDAAKEDLSSLADKEENPKKEE